MFSLVQKWRLYFIVSAVIFALGITSMVYSTLTYGAPFRMGIDFSGGTLLELHFAKPVTTEDVRAILVNAEHADAVVTKVQVNADQEDIVIRTKPIQSDAKVALEAQLSAKLGELTEEQFSSVGPTIGAETARAAAFAIVAAAAAILVFIAIAFYKVPKPFRWGVCAIAEMLHDIFIMLSFISIMGVLANWEVDSLFLTAVLTVAGFSVEDAIVVFDRIRENLKTRRDEPFDVIVNSSLTQTIHRSLAMGVVTMFVMFAITLFGGTSIRHFIITMLLGLVSGMYSSLFIGVPLLALWENPKLGRPVRTRAEQRATA
jgi:preprotein translocase SecF subunit